MTNSGKRKTRYNDKLGIKETLRRWQIEGSLYMMTNCDDRKSRYNEN